VCRLSAERSLSDAVDKSSLLKFFERSFCGTWRNIASFSDFPDGQAYSAVIEAVVAASDFDQHCTSGATQ
jgi:hypothetical protein